MTVNIAWGLVLVAHFGVQQLREFLFQRAYNAHLNALNWSAESYHE